MNIYYCTKEYCSFEMCAIVSAYSAEDALKMLMWKEDEDTKDITTIRIGIAFEELPKVWSEDSL